ncbi:DUF6146 family protein [Lutimonas saemankumensis]|uniref:DUF6146 family protein n=1 Tax=Lutimonas saemankumensis TaxID=483016 RepID=UPI001CD1C46A|nr:DUF6146 family protein [Lutimonas saemankumensis]MCA0931475.1 DUF6146 family protein [Lutimonas saemankumensis]
MKIDKSIIVTLFIGIIFAISCKSKDVQSGSVLAVNESERDTIVIENEELEYQIIIIEIGFDAWLATQRPMEYYTQPTLESKNLFWVTTYNQRVLRPDVYNPNIYMQTIEYDPKIDYGMEVNYLLYKYLEYFQKKYRQKL